MQVEYLRSERLLGEITHLPVQAGQGLLFMCLILSALILGVVKISKRQCRRNRLELLPCKRIWLLLRDTA